MLTTMLVNYDCVALVINNRFIIPVPRWFELIPRMIYFPIIYHFCSNYKFFHLVTILLCRSRAAAVGVFYKVLDKLRLLFCCAGLQAVPMHREGLRLAPHAQTTDRAMMFSICNHRLVNFYFVFANASVNIFRHFAPYPTLIPQISQH